MLAIQGGKKKIELSQNDFFNKRNYFFITRFYSAYAHLYSISNPKDFLNDKNIDKLNKLFKRILLNPKPEYNKSVQKLLKFQSKDMGRFTEIIKDLELKRKESGELTGTLYKPHTIGYVSYD